MCPRSCPCPCQESRPCPSRPPHPPPSPARRRPHQASNYSTTHNNLDQFNPAASANNFYILSIDGGGARGMIPAVILKEIERRTGKRIAHMFDRICGTSTARSSRAADRAKAVGQTEPSSRPPTSSRSTEAWARRSSRAARSLPRCRRRWTTWPRASRPSPRRANLTTYIAAHVGDTVELIQAAKKVPDLLARLNSRCTMSTSWHSTSTPSSAT